MSHDVPEADWRVFRELREVALERLCGRALDELTVQAGDTSLTCHQRYLAVYRALQERDAQVAEAFNDPRRSRMIAQLRAICALGLLEPPELARFTQQTLEAAGAPVAR